MVIIKYLYPMDFEEFLMALGEEQLLSEIKKHYISNTPLLDVIHNKALSLYKSYLILGGMPEVVLDYINKDRDITKVNLDIQEHIITAYMADMNKYTENTEGIKNNKIYQSIPRELARENNSFKFSLVDKC